MQHYFFIFSVNFVVYSKNYTHDSE